VSVDKLGGGFYRVVARHGIMEEPAMPKIMALMREQALDFDMENVSYFLGSEHLQAGDTDGMWRWQSALFRFLSRNALNAAVYFEIPIGQVIEIGIRLRV